MSKSRQHQPVLADATLFVGYRWLAWLAAGLVILWHDPVAPRFTTLLIAAAIVNLLATLLAQRYIRLVQRLPAVMSLDVVYCITILFMTGGWSGPMALYALSGIVLPALLFGWRGGLMAGLLAVSLNLALYLANGITPEQLISRNQQVELLFVMTAAPAFGCIFPAVLEMVRHAIAQRENQRRKPRSPFEEPRVDRSLDLDSINRVLPRSREQDRRVPALPELQPVRNTAVRTAEPNIEELRRVLCAPYPQPTGDLHELLNLLASRYSGHSNLRTRVTVLGRARAIGAAQQSVLLRLLQEALLNVQQHAHASKVELTLRYDALSVALLVQDNGVGLLDGTYERPGGVHALRAMHYRLAELGGRLDVFETEGGGVTVRATTPLE